MRRLVVVLTALAVLVAACGDDDGDEAAPTSSSTTTTAADDTGATTTTAAVAAPPATPGTPGEPVELEVTEVATGLDTVWAMAFDDDGKLWFTQRGGRLQQLDGPGRDIPGVVEQGEGGLMGLELDDQGRIYLMLTTASDNRIVRLAGLEAQPETIVQGIRKAAIHNGGRLRFGPDGTLYAGTGDAGDTSLPPKKDSINGKVIAIDPEAKGSTIVSSGHRNPQGLCFAPDGRFLSTEHGPDRGDEINVIEKGKDYGWPDSSGTGIQNWTPTIAPGGCVVYDGAAIPQWKGSLLFTTLKEQDLRRLTFAADGSVADEEVLYDRQYGRLRDVAVGPDGAVYLATSNKDTRGNPGRTDDRILRVAPA